MEENDASDVEGSDNDADIAEDEAEGEILAGAHVPLGKKGRVREDRGELNRGAVGIFGNRIKALLYSMVIPNADGPINHEEDAMVRKSLLRGIQLIGEASAQGIWKEEEMRTLSLLLLTEEEAGRRSLAPLASRYIQDRYLSSTGSIQDWVSGMAQWWSDAVKGLSQDTHEEFSDLEDEYLMERSDESTDMLDLIIQAHGADPTVPLTKLMGRAVEGIRVATQALLPHLSLLSDWRSQVDYLLGAQGPNAHQLGEEQQVKERWILVMLGEVIRLTHSSSHVHGRPRGNRRGVGDGGDMDEAEMSMDETEKELYGYLITGPSHRLVHLLQRLRNRPLDRALLVQGMLIDSRWGWWRGGGRGAEADAILMVLDAILGQMHGGGGCADWMIHSARCVGKCLTDEGGSWIRDRLEGQVLAWVTALWEQSPECMLTWMSVIMRYRDMEDLMHRQGGFSLYTNMWDRVGRLLAQENGPREQAMASAIDLVLLRTLWWIQRYIKSSRRHDPSSLSRDTEEGEGMEGEDVSVELIGGQVHEMSTWLDRAMNSLKAILQSRAGDRSVCRKVSTLL